MEIRERGRRGGDSVTHFTRSFSDKMERQAKAGRRWAVGANLLLEKRGLRAVAGLLKMTI